MVKYDITCVDASASSIKRARTNALLTKSNNIEFVNDEALAYLRKCVGKSMTYDVVIADMPTVGSAHGKRHAISGKIDEFITLIDSVCRHEFSIGCVNLYSGGIGITAHEIIKTRVGNVKLVESGTVVFREYFEKGIRVIGPQFVRWVKGA
ncbi:hypothetical protein ACA081_00745 [Candidatus Hodgkinia cicadicola]